MQRVLFAINPNSSLGSVASFVAQAKRQLPGHHVDFYVPQSVAEFAGLGAVASRQAPDLIVVVGGDGTTNLFLPCLVKSRLPVYLFPAGTANDLARQSGHKPDWRSLEGSLSHLESCATDLISVNGQLLATVGGLGVGATITHEMNNLRSCSGSFKALSRAINKHTYPLLGAKTILSGAYDKMSIELTTDTHHELFQTGCVLVANQSILGGDLLVTHESRNTDGMMEVMVLTDATRFGLAKALIDMRLGKVPSCAQIRKCRSARIKVLNHSNTTFFGDGETICKGNVFDLGVLPGSLFLIRNPSPSGAQR